MSSASPERSAADDRAVASWTTRVTVVATLRMLATMSVVPVAPRVIAAAVARSGSGSDVASHSASISFYGALAQLLVLPSCGALSDRVGRRPVLVACASAQLVGVGALWLAHSGALDAAALLAFQVSQQAASIVAVATTQASIGDRVAPGAIAAATGKVAGASMGCGQGRKRVRKSQLQRLISRSFSTRFG